jgi:hypothetical protein
MGAYKEYRNQIRAKIREAFTLSRFMRSNCCNYPVMTFYDFPKNGDWVACSYCGSLLAFNNWEALEMLRQDELPPSLFPSYSVYVDEKDITPFISGLKFNFSALTQAGERIAKLLRGEWTEDPQSTED